jgi:hypothetical protein
MQSENPGATASAGGSGFASTEDIITAMIAAGINCKIDTTETGKGKPLQTLCSYRSQDCYLRAPDGLKDQVTPAIYATPGQEQQAKEHFPDIGVSAAWGDGWSVDTQNPVILASLMLWMERSSEARGKGRGPSGTAEQP